MIQPIEFIPIMIHLTKTWPTLLPSDVGDEPLAPGQTEKAFERMYRFEDDRARLRKQLAEHLAGR